MVGDVWGKIRNHERKSKMTKADKMKQICETEAWKKTFRVFDYALPMGVVSELAKLTELATDDITPHFVYAYRCTYVFGDLFPITKRGREILEAANDNGANLPLFESIPNFEEDFHEEAARALVKAAHKLEHYAHITKDPFVPYVAEIIQHNMIQQGYSLPIQTIKDLQGIMKTIVEELRNAENSR